MKLIDPYTIRKAEQEFVGKVAAELDPAAISGLLKKQFGLEVKEGLRFQDATLKVQNQNVHFCLNAEALVTFSICLDRDGNFVSIESTAGVAGKAAHIDADLTLEEDQIDLDSLEEEIPLAAKEPDDIKEDEPWAPEDEAPAEGKEYEDALKELGTLDIR